MAALSEREVARLVGYSKFWHGMRRRVEAGKLDRGTPVGIICSKAGHVPDGRLVAAGTLRGRCDRCGWSSNMGVGA